MPGMLRTKSKYKKLANQLLKIPKSLQQRSEKPSKIDRKIDYMNTVYSR